MIPTLWARFKTYVYGAAGAIVLLVAAFIYALLGKNRALKSKVENLEGEKGIRDELQKYDTEKAKADDAEADYNRLRAAYTKSSGDGPRSDDTGTEPKS